MITGACTDERKSRNNEIMCLLGEEGGGLGFKA
jgi:hypothetical protein